MRNIPIIVSLMMLLHFGSGQQLYRREVNISLYTLSWSEAQAFCRKNYTDLVTIRSETDFQAMQGIGGWTGLYRNSSTQKWKWSRGDENPAPFIWNHTDQGTVGDCVLKWFPSSQLATKSCGEKRFAMCYNEILVLVKENKTWEEALEHCRTLKIENRYNLATLTTPDDHDFAREKSQQATTDEVWTGLRYLGDDWFWAGGEPVLYQNIPSCPALRCGVLEKNSNTSFGIRDCSQRRNFLCYRKPKNL